MTELTYLYDGRVGAIYLLYPRRTTAVVLLGTERAFIINLDESSLQRQPLDEERLPLQLPSPGIFGDGIRHDVYHYH